MATWEQELSSRFDGIRNTFWGELVSLDSDDENFYEKFREAARETTSQSSAWKMQAVREQLTAIEQSYEQQIIKYTKAYCGSIGKPYQIWMQSEKAPGWLSTALQSSLLSTSTSLKELKEALEALLNFDEDWSGVKGMAKQFVRGYTRPLDTLAGFFGAGSVEQERDYYVSCFQKASGNLEEAVELLIVETLDSINSNWKMEVVELTTRVQNGSNKS